MPLPPLYSHAPQVVATVSHLASCQPLVPLDDPMRVRTRSILMNSPKSLSWERSSIDTSTLTLYVSPPLVTDDVPAEPPGVAGAVRRGPAPVLSAPTPGVPVMAVIALETGPAIASRPLMRPSPRYLPICSNTFDGDLTPRCFFT